ncbi:hypothetical protein M5G07_08485 [Serratia symbiotica]|nr:hypothetical protein [Serratia symbiotica]MCP1065535.1 hypothetical protein [Serratia symbiotica]
MPRRPELLLLAIAPLPKAVELFPDALAPAPAAKLLLPVSVGETCPLVSFTWILLQSSNVNLNFIHTPTITATLTQ